MPVKEEEVPVFMQGKSKAELKAEKEAKKLAKKASKVCPHKPRPGRSPPRVMAASGGRGIVWHRESPVIRLCAGAACTHRRSLCRGQRPERQQLDAQHTQQPRPPLPHPTGQGAQSRQRLPEQVSERDVAGQQRNRRLEREGQHFQHAYRHRRARIPPDG